MRRRVLRIYSSYDFLLLKHLIWQKLLSLKEKKEEIMNEKIRTLLYKCHILVVKVNKNIIRIIPKEKNLIMFSAWFGQKYQDNAMYMYEYFLKKKGYKAVWYTRNKSIYDKLTKEGKPVVFGNSIKAIWTQIRAKMLVSAVQFSDFNQLFLSNCIFIDLGHGFPNKQIGYKQPDSTERSNQYTRLLRKGIQFYMTAASPVTRDIQMDTFDLDSKHVLFCNKPRTDVLFDPNLRIGKNDIINKIKGSRKAIVYMPTHRSCGEVPLVIEDILDLDSIEEICEKNNAVFIIKKHYYHNKETTDLSCYKYIFDVTQKEIDTQTFLYQADVVVSDYSSAYIDYLLLDRPVILYTFDLDDYLKKERGLYLGINDNYVGFKPCTSEEFIESLRCVCSDWSDKQHEEGRRNLRNHYFSEKVSVGNAREEVFNIMVKLLKGKYKSNWKEGEK